MSAVPVAVASAVPNEAPDRDVPIAMAASIAAEPAVPALPMDESAVPVVSDSSSPPSSCPAPQVPVPLAPQSRPPPAHASAVSSASVGISTRHHRRKRAIVYTSRIRERLCPYLVSEIPTSNDTRTCVVCTLLNSITTTTCEACGNATDNSEALKLALEPPNNGSV